MRSKKEKERLEYIINNLRLPNLRCIKVSKRISCSTVRVTSRIYRVSQTLITSIKS